MSPETFVDVFREALWLVTIMVCAVILPSLMVGLVVAIFQAATSINEQTLSQRNYPHPPPGGLRSHAQNWQTVCPATTRYLAETPR